MTMRDDCLRRRLEMIADRYVLVEKTVDFGCAGKPGLECDGFRDREMRVVEGPKAAFCARPSSLCSPIAVGPHSPGPQTYFIDIVGAGHPTQPSPSSAPAFRSSVMCFMQSRWAVDGTVVARRRYQLPLSTSRIHDGKPRHFSVQGGRNILVGCSSCRISGGCDSGSGSSQMVTGRLELELGRVEARRAASKHSHAPSALPTCWCFETNTKWDKECATGKFPRNYQRLEVDWASS